MPFTASSALSVIVPLVVPACVMVIVSEPVVPALQPPVAVSVLAAVMASGRLQLASTVIEAPATGSAGVSSQIKTMTKPKNMRFMCKPPDSSRSSSRSRQ